MIKEYEDKRNALIKANDWRCEVCGKVLHTPDLFQLAHRIPKTKLWVKKYGVEIIDHVLNLSAVCSLKCNSSVLIDKRDLKREELVKRIKRDIK